MANRKSAPPSEEEEQYYEALADRAERGEFVLDSRDALRGDAAAAHGREFLRRAGIGRPPMDPGAKVGEHARKRQVRIPVEMDRQLNSLAAAEHRSASDIMRAALKDYLKRHSAR